MTQVTQERKEFAGMKRNEEGKVVSTHNVEIQEFEVGDFASGGAGTDTDPFEIVEIKSDKCILIRAMECTRLPWDMKHHVGGFAGHCSNQNDQKWKIESDTTRELIKVKKAKDGKWYGLGGMRGQKYILGSKPIKFYDFNF